ncbi:MAG: response regulator [Propionibacteriales bacterium]|nr:response regulator [Propionibacteriales bacterium]
MEQRVLVVEDDTTVAEVVDTYLRHAGYAVDRVGDGPRALAALGTSSYALVVLDVMLPGINGLEVCRRVRSADPDLPVIMLTALGEEHDRLVGLELGADDYVTKPFSPRELVLRVQSVLRRATHRPPDRQGAPVVTDGPLRLDPVAHEVTLDGAVLALTGREFDLLRHLVTHPRVAFSRAELLEQVWGWTFGDESTVTVHVRRLREKIEHDASAPERLQTVWGVGYRWEPFGAGDRVE